MVRIRSAVWHDHVNKRSPRTPAAEQIALELAILTADRARQQAIQQAIAELEQLNRRSEA